MRHLAIAVVLAVSSAALAAPPSRPAVSLRQQPRAARKEVRQLVRANPRVNQIYKNELADTRPEWAGSAALIFAGTAGTSITTTIYSGNPWHLIPAAMNVGAALYYQFGGETATATKRTVQKIIDAG